MDRGTFIDFRSNLDGVTMYFSEGHASLTEQRRHCRRYTAHQGERRVRADEYVLSVAEMHSWTKEVEQAILQGVARGLSKYQPQMQQGAQCHFRENCS